MRELREHQKQAVEAITNGLKTHERGQLIMACGSGKTLTALNAAQAIGSRRTLVLLPSLALVKQTLDEWRNELGRDFTFLTVCSDETVVSDDHMIQHTSELGVPTTTDAEEIGQFLRGRNYPRVVFSTYHSIEQVAEAQRQGAPTFDLVLADEAHRTAGSLDKRGALVLTDAIKADRRLFLTATPRVIRGLGARRAASMDNESLYGPRLFHYPFSQAIDDGLLCDYDIALLVLRGKDVAPYLQDDDYTVDVDGVATDVPTLAAQVGVLKAMQELKLHRVVSFHGRLQRAEEFARALPTVASWLPRDERPKGLNADFIKGTMLSDVRAGKIDRLRTATNREHMLLSNARCLSEGVDVPNLDAVVFVDPRSSHVDIVQAVGRAIRTAPGKQRGVVLLPLFMHEGENMTEVLSDRGYQHIWTVLRALRTHDSVLATQLDSGRAAMKRGEAAKLPDKIKIMAPEGLEDRITDAITVQVLEKAGLIEVNLERMRELRAQGLNYHRVAQQMMAEGWPNARGIVKWAGINIQFYLEGKPKTVAGVVERWRAKYDELIEWTEVIGPLRLRNDGMELPTSRWISSQKDMYHGKSKNKISSERIALLEKLPGWSWDRQQQRPRQR